MKTRVILSTAALLFAVLSISACATSKTGRLEGSVSEFDTGNPIPSALVSVIGTTFTTLTDTQGSFSFDDVEVGLYDVSITRTGYDPITIKAVKITSSATRTLSVSLKRSAKVDSKGAPLTTTKLQAPAMSAGQLSPQGDYLRKEKASGEVDREQTTDKRVVDDGITQSAPSDNYGREYIAPCPQPSIPMPQPLPRDMYFQDYGTNGFVDTRHDRLSTFAADVDDASYNLAKQYLLEGNLPPQDAIRVEEFVNHFDYGYRAPDDAPFRIFTELSSSPFRVNSVLLKLGIKGRELSRGERKPLRLTFVIDCSGSMNYDNRIELVKQALRMMVNQLNKRDQVGIVSYGYYASVVLNPTSISNRREIFGAIDRLYPNGSTYAEAGLKLGYQMANQQFSNGCNNDIVLFSDGVANVGRVDADDIMSQIKRFAYKGITLSTFGVGMGNYNDVLLENLAKEGNGRYAYVNNIDEARKQFVEQLTGNVQVIGRDMKIQLEFNPTVVASYRLLGYENRAVADRKFRDSRQDGGEVGSGHEVTALYELMLTGRRTDDNIGAVAVRWKNPGETEVTEVDKDIATAECRRDFYAARPEFRLAFVASQFAEILKGTAYSERIDLDDLSRMAHDIDSELNTEQTGELVSLIDRAASLSGYHSEWKD